MTTSYRSFPTSVVLAVTVLLSRDAGIPWIQVTCVCYDVDLVISTRALLQVRQLVLLVKYEQTGEERYVVERKLWKSRT